MNIMDLARQANLPACHTTHPKALARFAALVRAEVLEEAAGVCDPEPSLPNEAYTVHNNKVTMRRCAAAIRALAKEKT
jgi:hypothetical protein